jgi:hypothetical protein
MHYGNGTSTLVYLLVTGYVDTTYYDTILFRILPILLLQLQRINADVFAYSNPNCGLRNLRAVL